MQKSGQIWVHYKNFFYVIEFYLKFSISFLHATRHSSEKR